MQAKYFELLKKYRDSDRRLWDNIGFVKGSVCLEFVDVSEAGLEFVNVSEGVCLEFLDVSECVCLGFVDVSEGV